VSSSTLTLSRGELFVRVNLALESLQERSPGSRGRLARIRLRVLRVRRRTSAKTTLSRGIHTCLYRHQALDTEPLSASRDSASY
jgi:hypothetical protein